MAAVRGGVEAALEGMRVADLALVAPGTELREAIENILNAQGGALIVIGADAEVERLIDGGFRVDCPFSAPRLYELCKMDGAVVVSGDLSTIRFANVQLQPDPSIPSHETGTRHRTAERVARQTGALVVAISERRRLVTVYRKTWKYVLQDLSVVLAKANQALQTLSGYRALLDRALAELTAAEFEGAVTRLDVARTLHRAIVVGRIGEEIARYVAELGKEGTLVGVQLRELLEGVGQAQRLLVRDYAQRPAAVANPDEVLAELAERARAGELEMQEIARVLGFSDLDGPAEPRGYRILARIPRLPAAVADNLVARFRGLTGLLRAATRELDEVDGVGEARARAIRERLGRMREEAVGWRH